MFFEIINQIKIVETIAVGGNIRDIMRIRKQYGVGRWRKSNIIHIVNMSDFHHLN